VRGYNVMYRKLASAVAGAARITSWMATHVLPEVVPATKCYSRVDKLAGVGAHVASNLCTAGPEETNYF